MFSVFFIIFVFIHGVGTDERVSVYLYKGDSITIHINNDTQRNDLIQWRFGDQDDLLAKINRPANLFLINDTVLDGRFRDRLKLNNQTGDLTITNITTQHTGNYTLYIKRGEVAKTVYFSVHVFGDKVKTEMKGDSVVLHNNVTKKPGDEKMLFRIRLNNSDVAEINGTVSVHDERFRGRLQVDDQTGDLNITNITSDDSGSYEVNITVGNNIYTIHRSFSVNVKEQDPSSGLSTGEKVGIGIGVGGGGVAAAALVAAVFLIYRRCNRTTGNNGEGITRNNAETGEELRAMNEPLRNGDPSGSDAP